MKEIGGYFGLEQLVSNEYYADLISLNSGRNCLLYLLEMRKIKKIYIPHLLCDSVSIVCNKNGYKFEYYYIDAEFMPVFNKVLDNNEYIYIVNYYGQITEEKIRILKAKYINIIIDNAQAFFQSPVSGIDTIYSCRKFFGVPDGAYLSTNVLMGEVLEVDRSSSRMKHILGRYEDNASDYYADFKESDKSFDIEPLKYMSRLTHNILGAIDYERICSIRNDNYAYLTEKLCSENNLKLTSPNGAFAYPFYVENGTKIRSAFAQKNIYIPTLWPNVLNNMPIDCIEYDYSKNILPLPCDQRYTINDMKYIVDEIFLF